MRRRKRVSSLTDLENALKDFGLMNPDMWRETLSWFYIWVQSKYVSWPFPGGTADQPAWLTHDFGVLSTLDAWIDVDRQTLDESRAANGDVMDY